MKKLQGAITALVTPFNKDESIDYGALRALVDFQIDQGITALLPMGTTGESPTVTHEEHNEIIKVVAEQSKGRVPIIAGTGSNCTEEAIRITKSAIDNGANYSLQVTPYYNKPNQVGIFKHFEDIAKNCDIPIILYNIAGRSGVNIETDTVIKLSKIDNIVGVKEASGSVSQAIDVIVATDDDFALYSGDDGLTLPIITMGGDGVISVASNIIPAKMEELAQLALKGEIAEARALNASLNSFFHNIFIDTNPIPIKYAMARANFFEEVYRLPMSPMTDENKRILDKDLKALGLI